MDLRSPIAALVLSLAASSAALHAAPKGQQPKAAAPATPKAAAPASPKPVLPATAATPASSPLPTPMVGSARLVAVMPTKSGAPALIGRSGEIYMPSADLKWKRTGAGGVSTDVLSVFKGANASLYAVGSRAPLFQRLDGVWSSYHLVNDGRAAVSPGPIPIISIGRHIYELSGGTWNRIASAKGTVSALYAGRANEIFLVTSTGKLYVGRKGWRPLPLSLPADDQVRAIVGVPGKHQVIVTEKHKLYLLNNKGAKLIALGPEHRGLQIHCLGVADGKLYLAGQVGTGPSTKSILAELESQKLLTKDTLWPLQPRDRFVLVHEDHKQRLMVATRQGQLRLRSKDGSWRNGLVDISPPAPPENFAGRGPALSK